jgi:3-methyladenine DNA glycosylase AlkD
MSLDQLKASFSSAKNPKIAAGQKAYMRDQFEFLGIKAPIRRKLQKPFLSEVLISDCNKREKVIRELWSLPEREYQYFGQELIYKYKSKLEKGDVQLIEFMVTHKSWWDTVDFIASKIAGYYFFVYPETIADRVEKWLESENIWLIRTALLFQLHYKGKTDTRLLQYLVESQLGSEEFFINKAIGWVLRNYSRVNPDWVRDFADRTALHPLSRREGLRLLK